MASIPGTTYVLFLTLRKPFAQFGAVVLNLIETKERMGFGMLQTVVLHLDLTSWISNDCHEKDKANSQLGEGNSFSHLGQGYGKGPEANRTTLFGKQKFRVSDYEVFKIVVNRSIAEADMLVPNHPSEGPERQLFGLVPGIKLFMNFSVNSLPIDGASQLLNTLIFPADKLFPEISSRIAMKSGFMTATRSLTGLGAKLRSSDGSFFFS